MANYIGNQPLNGEFKVLDSIESQFNNSSTSFGLKYNTASQTVGDAAQLIVSLNGVIQQPLTSYTLSGVTNIVFASPPSSGDTCFIILLGGIGGTVTPSDNSVTTEKLTNSSVTSAKIVNNTITADDMDSSDSYAFAGVNVGSTFVTDTVNDRIGVGTTNPTYPLDVEDDGAGFIKGSFVSTGSSHSSISFDNTGSAAASVRVGSNNDDFYVRTSGSEKLRVTSAGNVGIGTTSPSSALDVDVSQNSETNIELTNTNTGSAAQVRTKYTTDGGLFTVGKTSDAHPFGGDAYLYNVDNTNIRFATNDTERMRIDSSGNVGIGVTDPSSYYAQNLVVKAPAEGGITIRSNSTTDTNYLMFADGTAGTAAYRGYIGYSHNSPEHFNVVSYGYTRFYTGDPAAERMRIDNNGNVGIGTSSPTQKLQVSGGSFLQQQSGATNNTAATAVTVSNLTTGAHAAGLGASLLFTHVNSGGGYNGPKISSVSNADPFTSNLVFYSHNYSHSEAMRIDSSGNLLVGTTNPTPHNLTSGGGFSVRGPINLFSIARQDNEVMIVNRTGTDGDHALFRKNGTTVGSIGNASSLNIIYLAGQDSGIKILRPGTGIDGLLPCDNTGSNRDALMDLGSSGVRFKDLYMSGGVYLGGSTSSNFLDDYEEGLYTATLTPSTSGTITLSSSYNQLSYTKVGRKVTVNGRIRVNSVSSPVGQMVRISLPFVVMTSNQESERAMPTVLVQNAAQDTGSYHGHPTADGISYTELGRSNSYATNAAQDFSGNEYVSVNLTYFTA